MALSGGHTGTAVGGLSLRIDWSATQSISNNTSTITAKAYLVIASGWSINIGSRTGVITIDGTNTTITYNLGLVGAGSHLIGTASKIITHNTDGTKSFAINGSAKIEATVAGYGWIGTLTKGSNTYTLDTIPRYAVIESFEVSDASYDSVQINFTTDKAISKAQVQSRNGAWQNVTNGGRLTGLQSGTTHEIRLWVEAADSELGTYSSYKTITTKTLPTITSLVIEDVTLTSLKPVYTTTGKVDIAQVSVNGEAWENTFNRRVMMGFTPGDAYSIRIRVRPDDYDGWAYSYVRHGSLVKNSIVDTVANTNINENITVSITRYDPGVTHTLVLLVKNDLNDWIEVTSVFDVSTNYIFALSEPQKNIIYQAVKTKKEATFRVAVMSIFQFLGGSNYSVEKQLLFVGVNPEIGTLSYRDTLVQTKALTPSDQFIIQNKSDLQLTVGSLTAKKEATIANLEIKVGPLNRVINYSTATVGSVSHNLNKIDAPDDLVAQIIVTDSRGFKTTKEITINFIPYKNPFFVIYQATRANAYEDDSYMDYQIELSQIVKPVYKTRYWIRPKGTTNWGTQILTTTNNTIEDISDERFIAQVDNYFLGAKLNTTSFEIKLQVEDTFGIYDVILSLDAASGLLIIDRYGAAWQERIFGISEMGNKSYLATMEDLLNVGGSSAWADITNKPVTATRWPTFAEVTSKPVTATRWPTWSEVTSKPDLFAPSTHSHPWNEIYNQPTTATRWPTWNEVTSKPAMADYVVEEGPNYTKWNSGKLEQGILISGTAAANTSSTINGSFSVTFTSTRTLVASIRTASLNATQVTLNRAIQSGSSAVNVTVSNTRPAAQNVEIYVAFVGTWK